MQIRHILARAAAGIVILSVMALAAAAQTWAVPKEKAEIQCRYPSALMPAVFTSSP